MKIAYIANIRLPTEKAHGLQIMKTCEALAGQGVDLGLIVPRRINRLKQDPFVFYGVKKDFKITRLWCLDFLILPFLKTLWFWLESLCFAKITFIYLFFKKFSVYYTRDALIALFLSFNKAPLFYEIHTVPESGVFWHKLAWRRAKAIMAISNGIKKSLIDYGVPPEKIFIVRDAVDTEKFKIQELKEECRKKLDLPTDSKIVLYTGHLYEWKGATTLLEAARNFQLPRLRRGFGGQATPNFQNILFVFVGGTKEDIENFKKKSRGLNNVVIVGYKPHSEIPLWLKAADVLVLPNSAKSKIGSEYTSPLKLFEYMASGAPIVASDVPALREILNPDNSFFFEPDNPRSLAERILEIFKNPQIADLKAKKALKDTGKYTWEERGRLILEIIEKSI